VQTGDIRHKQQWNNGRPQQQRFHQPQRFPQHRQTLLGEGPRPQMRGQRPQGHQQVQQFQGNLFTDFNKPMRSTGPMPQTNPNQPRGIRPGPGFQNQQMNGMRPSGMMMRGQRGPNAPHFPRPNMNQNMMRPRGPPGYPGNMPHNRPMNMMNPNNNWRNNRPDMRPGFQGPPNPMSGGGMPMIQPVGPIFSQEPRPPFFMDQGGRPEMNPQFNPNVATVQPMQQPYPTGPAIPPGAQPPRMHLIRPDMQPPVQPVQPFFQAPHPQAPYMEEPHHLPPQGQGYWSHPNVGPSEPSGWNNNSQNYMGPPVGPPMGVRMPPPVEQVMPHQQQQPHSYNNELQIHPPPRSAPYEEQTRSQQPYYEQPHQSQQQQEHRYPHHDEHRSSHQSSYDRDRDSHQSSRREDYRDRHDYDRSYHDEPSRYHSKRKYDYEEEDRYSSRSPEKVGISEYCSRFRSL
jgi:hypothetical protein